MALALMAWQLRMIKTRDRDLCFKAFLNNNWVGAALFAGLALDYQLPISVFTSTCVSCPGSIHASVSFHADELLNIGALNFVLHDALTGGVSTLLSSDLHGKSFSAIMVNLDLPEPEVVFGLK